MEDALSRTEFDYVEIMAQLGEINAPPGGVGALASLVSLWPRTLRRGIDVGCNTGAFTLVLANLTGAEITGIDLSEEMIATARTRPTPAGLSVQFKTGDAASLSFADESLDFVFSGGSTAFVQQRHQAYHEYQRVIRPGGIVSELNFFYERQPPQRLVDELERILGFPMAVWQKDDWLGCYAAAGLEPVHVSVHPPTPQETDVRQYVEALMSVRGDAVSSSDHRLKGFLESCFATFAENNSYLSVLATLFEKPIIARQARLFSR